MGGGVAGMSIRSNAIAIVGSVVPSDYGDAKFSALIGDMYTEGPRAGSTCGFLTSYLLFQLGCRSPLIVNRNDPGSGLVYKIGANVSRLVGGAKALGAWRTGPSGIRPGDIYFISNGPSETEHVGVYLAAPDGSYWDTADAGQTNSGGHQAARYVTRDFDGVRLGPNQVDEDPDPTRVQPPKIVQGYIDIEALPYGVPAVVASKGKWIAVGVAVVVVAFAAGWLE